MVAVTAMIYLLNSQRSLLEEYPLLVSNWQLCKTTAHKQDIIQKGTYSKNVEEWTCGDGS